MDRLARLVATANAVDNSHYDKGFKNDKIYVSSGNMIGWDVELRT